LKLTGGGKLQKNSLGCLRRLPFNGEKNDEPDGDEAERVGREQEALADSRCVDPANAVSSRPQREAFLQPVQQDVGQQDEAVGQRDGRQIKTRRQSTHSRRPGKHSQRQRVAQETYQQEDNTTPCFSTQQHYTQSTSSTPADGGRITPIS